MFVRTVYATGNPDRIDRTLDGFATEAVDLLSGQPGYRGFGLFADRTVGKITMGSWWESAEAERASDAALGERRRALLAPLAGTVTTDVWEAVATAPPGVAGPGARFRLSKSDVDPAKVDTAAELFSGQVLPVLAKQAGFVTGAMLADRATGRLSVGAIYADQASFDAARGPTADSRARALTALGGTLRSLEEFEVVLLDRRATQG
ncbi:MULTISPECIES: antibiotic biosynthesis monooxygenase [Streptomyces]|uniref:antibiotic biosynthesis monooxygenase n=1 Tax=Streptomyces TaxID=1883 RepID=UPI0004A9E7FC|nr:MULTISPECIES: antibiotic biosynthesis monooxygenase [Streptomyces]